MTPTRADLHRLHHHDHVPVTILARQFNMTEVKIERMLKSMPGGCLTDGRLDKMRAAQIRAQWWPVGYVCHQVRLQELSDELREARG